MSITEDDIQKILNSLIDNEFSPTTVKIYRSLLSHIFSVASKTKNNNNQFIFQGQNPVQNTIFPPVKNIRERFLTGEEAEALIGAAEKLPSPDLHAFIVISLNTGLRLGEIQRLDWIDVDITNTMLTVRDEVFRKPGGKVPLNATALNIFITLKQNCPHPATGSIFPHLAYKDVCNKISLQSKNIFDSLGLNNHLNSKDRKYRVVFHTLRHTFASWLAIGGTDIFRIQKLMRHKNINMTMRYAHLIPDATREAVHNLKPPNL